MPTKAGRIRIEDLRVGRLIWDLAIDWTTFSTYPRAVKIVQLKRYGNDFIVVTREPDEGHLHTFFTNHRITRCGFYGVHDQSRLLKELVDGTVTPCSFFVNAKAVLRYRDRLLSNTCSYETLGYMPGRVKAEKGVWRDPRGRSWPMTEQEVASQNEIITTIRDMAYQLYRASGYKTTADAMRDAIASKSEPVKGQITDVEKAPVAKYEKNFPEPTVPYSEAKAVFEHSSAQNRILKTEKLRGELAELGARIWSKLQIEQSDSALTKFSNEQLVKAVDGYIQGVLTNPRPVDEIKVENLEQHPDGSITFSITGPRDVIERLTEAKQQAMSMRAVSVDGTSQEDPGTLQLPASYGKADPDQVD